MEKFNTYRPAGNSYNFLCDLLHIYDD